MILYKLQLTLLVMSQFLVLAKADDDCSSFFPTVSGTILTNETYDSADKLISSLTYEVNKDQISYQICDRKGKNLGSGFVDMECVNHVLLMKAINNILLPEIAKNLGSSVEFISDYIDYPDLSVTSGKVELHGGKFILRSKSDKKEILSVKILEREYDKSEKVICPAGVFTASKVKFIFEVTQNKNVKKYEGVEWYSMKTGLIRSETYDEASNLVCYTVLSSKK